MVFSKAISGGIMLALLILMFPTLFGEGYQSLKSLNNDQSHDLLTRSVFEDAVTNDRMWVGLVAIIMIIKVLSSIPNVDEYSYRQS
jgi:CIC family chloride channel protein